MAHETWIRRRNTKLVYRRCSSKPSSVRGKSSEKVSEQAISRLHNSDADETAGIVPGWLRIIRNEPLRFLRPFDTCVLPLAVLSHQQTRNNPVHKPITETSANEEARGKKEKRHNSDRRVSQSQW